MYEPIQKQDIAAIADAVAIRLQTERSIDVVKHAKHHQFIDRLISECSTRADRREQIVRAALGWGLIVMITGVGVAAWSYLKIQIKG